MRTKQGCLIWDSRVVLGLVIRICVFSALCPGYPAFWGNVFSLVQTPLLNQIGNHSGDLSLPVEIFASHEVGGPILDTSFGSERGSHLIRRCSLGWAYDAGRRCAGFSSPPLLSFISRLLLRFCFLRYYGMSGTWFLKGNLVSEAGVLFCFWVLVWGSLLDRIRLIWRFRYRWSRMIA